MTTVLGFDVYGTLVDPLAMTGPIWAIPGVSDADRMAALWRSTQIEYAFRRAVMGAYVDFDVCTRQALQHAFRVTGLSLDRQDEVRLLDSYLQLPAYSDTAAGLDALRSRGYRLIAFSNGVERSVRTVLGNAMLLDRFDEVVSVDDLRTFKPDPAVYRYLVERGGSTEDRTWLISGNGWDVIGAKNTGLRAAWIRRSDRTHLDPWEFAPDLVVPGIGDLADALPR